VLHFFSDQVIARKQVFHNGAVPFFQRLLFHQIGGEGQIEFNGDVAF
jgi:hypothetical protein